MHPHIGNVGNAMLSVTILARSVCLSVKMSVRSALHQYHCILFMYEHHRFASNFDNVGNAKLSVTVLARSVSYQYQTDTVQYGTDRTDMAPHTTSMVYGGSRYGC
jgi:hypothetical protein